MKGKFQGLEYESGLEKKFLEWCYKLGVRVARCNSWVPYIDADGISHRYNPDFVLVDYDYVVEIKGLWALRENHAHVREKYHAAYKQFSGRYSLLTEKELRSDFVGIMMRDLYNAKHAPAHSRR